MNGNRPLIGIDVGWSTKRKSCAIATRNVDFGPTHFKRYENGVVAGRMRLDELVHALSAWARTYPDQVSNAVIVLDGPLGRGSPPSVDRAVDSACAVHQFYGRTQPLRISHPSSKPFIAATYKIVDALQSSARDKVRFVLNGETDGLALFETHPTVGLCLLVPSQDVSSLPSRERARLLPGGSAVRAKSDWYWAIGANTQVASALGSSDAEAEDDHELVAALYCLAVAHQLVGSARDGSRAVLLGDGAGVYAIPAAVDRTWVDAVRQVGILAGALTAREGRFKS